MKSRWNRGDTAHNVGHCNISLHQIRRFKRSLSFYETVSSGQDETRRDEARRNAALSFPPSPLTLSHSLSLYLSFSLLDSTWLASQKGFAERTFLISTITLKDPRNPDDVKDAARKLFSQLIVRAVNPTCIYFLSPRLDESSHFLLVSLSRLSKVST